MNGQQAAIIPQAIGYGGAGFVGYKVGEMVGKSSLIKLAGAALGAYLAHSYLIPNYQVFWQNGTATNGVAGCSGCGW